MKIKFVLLVLVTSALACQSISTPPPQINISDIIAQTAAAAQTQTMQAIPPTLTATATPIPLYSGNPENFIPSTSELPEGFVILTDESGPSGNDGYTVGYTKIDTFQIVYYISYIKKDVFAAQERYKQIVQTTNASLVYEANVDVFNVDEYTAGIKDVNGGKIVTIIFRKLNFVGTVMVTSEYGSTGNVEQQANFYTSIFLEKIQKQFQNTSSLQIEMPTDVSMVATTNTPESTNMPLPPSTSPTPIVLTGSGDSIVDFDNPYDMAIVHITGNASSHFFAVKNYGSDGNSIDLLVNTTDPYDGIRPLDFGKGEHTTRFEVSASDEWKIEVLPITSARILTVPGSIEGKGDDVILVKGGTPNLAKIKGNAESSFFAVKSYGINSDLLVNTTDPYDGTVMVSSDTVILEIQASNNWTIEITVK